MRSSSGPFSLCNGSEPVGVDQRGFCNLQRTRNLNKTRMRWQVFLFFYGCTLQTSPLPKTGMNPALSAGQQKASAENSEPLFAWAEGASAAFSMSCHARQPPARSVDDAVGAPGAPRAPEDGERTAPSRRPGRRVQNPNGAWACPGHALSLLVHLALLSAASGWKLPSRALPNDATNGRSRARRQLAGSWCVRPAL